MPLRACTGFTASRTHKAPVALASAAAWYSRDVVPFLSLANQPLHRCISKLITTINEGFRTTAMIMVTKMTMMETITMVKETKRKKTVALRNAK